MSSQFERLGTEVLYEGKFLKLENLRVRHEDGDEVEREIVSHPGAVGIVVLDGESLWLVRQPRGAGGVPDLLGVPAGTRGAGGGPGWLGTPAGKLSEGAGEPLDCAKRERTEEIGKQAAHWESLGSFF